jgi:hypothetical protein
MMALKRKNKNQTTGRMSDRSLRGEKEKRGAETTKDGAVCVSFTCRLLLPVHNDANRFVL